jgi:CDP-diacylglycerol--glycerol-3-phosphate 3-phosphatidyltransferase
MFTEWLRRVTIGITVPIARFLGRLGISANAITVLGCILNIGVAFVIAAGHLRLAGLLLIFAAGLDGIDGVLARQMGTTTKFGAFLDSVLDRVSESALLLGLAWWYMSQSGHAGQILAYITIAGSLMVSYVRARAEGIGVDCKVGILTRVERTLLFIAGLLFGLTLPVLWILALGTTFTTAQRILYVYRLTKSASL